MRPLGSNSTLRDESRLRGLAPWVVIPALLVVLAAVPASAQQGGTVTGTVVDARTQAPISSAQVFLAGTGIGTLTAANGRFLLLDVPAGTHEIRVERIGYADGVQSVTVRAGESQAVSFQLAEDVLELDELVVTGEAGAARRREIGNTITQINLTDVQEPVVGLEGLLQGRATGLAITESGSQAGSGAMIRLRGNVSISQSNTPLVYIDGVRTRSDPYPRNVGPVGTKDNRSPNTVASPLNDIDPSTIERIEIIKGAAATALYGTEAAAGVIQIFTKKGTPGRTRWTLQVDQGFTDIQSFNHHTDVYPYFRTEPWLRKGYQQSYSLSAQGTQAGIAYYVSGTYGDDDYSLVLDNETKGAFRVNMGFNLLGVNVQWNTGYILSDITNTPSGNNSNGPYMNAYRGDANYVGGYDVEVINKTLDLEHTEDIERLTSGVTLTYSPSSAFSNRLVFGFDRTDMELISYRPFGYILEPLGARSDKRWVGQTLTFDYSGSYRFDLGRQLGATFSWGAQTVETEELTTHGWGEYFPGPGDAVVSNGSIQLASEERIRVINGGFFGQVRFDVRDRIFLTAGLRMDGNSAFGQDLGLEPYPKASLSYVISDEAFWPKALGTLKLRTGYGHSGRAPGAFDAVRTWAPTSLAGQPGFIPQNLGNPKLGPERTAEIEAGFDAGWLGNRVTAELTWYQRTTSDALFPVSNMPSQGGWRSQLQNVGKVRNRGIELSVDATVLESRDFGWDLGLGVATNHSEVLTLGGAAPFSVGNLGWIREGQPAPVIIGEKVLNEDEFADPKIDANYAYGPNQPTTIITPSSRIRLPGGVILSARGEYLGGFYMQDGPSGNATGRSIEWPACSRQVLGDISKAIAAKQLEGISALERRRCDLKKSQSRTWVYPGDFFKVRDVTLSVPVDFLLPWGEDARLSLTARNAIRWLNDGFWAFDPEMPGNDGADTFVRGFSEHVPPPAVYTASLRINF
ncbi:MAG: TonB-dependent receptor [Gemmatimonadetes bacterium]|nr:TonB-dependent receptor [Gemmatimonadota bacterium]